MKKDNCSNCFWECFPKKEKNSFLNGCSALIIIFWVNIVLQVFSFFYTFRTNYSSFYWLDQQHPLTYWFTPRQIFTTASAGLGRNQVLHRNGRDQHPGITARVPFGKKLKSGAGIHTQIHIQVLWYSCEQQSLVLTIGPNTHTRQSSKSWNNSKFFHWLLRLSSFSQAFFVLFLRFVCLKGNVTERKRDLPRAISLHKCLWYRGWARPKPEARNSICISQVVDRDPSTWVIICCLPSHVRRRLDWKCM